MLSSSLLISVCVQVDMVGIHNMNIEIIGIVDVQKTQTQLEVKLDQKIQTLTVASRLLAEAFGVKQDEDFQERLVRALPVLAEARIEGKKITKITRSQK